MRCQFRFLLVPSSFRLKLIEWRIELVNPNRIELRDAASLYGGMLVAGALLIAAVWFFQEVQHTTAKGLLRLTFGCFFGSLLIVSVLATGIQLTSRRSFEAIRLRLTGRHALMTAFGFSLLVSIFAMTYFIGWTTETVLKNFVVRPGIETIILVLLVSFLVAIAFVVRLLAVLAYMIRNRDEGTVSGIENDN